MDFLDWENGESTYNNTNGKYCVDLNHGKFDSESPLDEHPFLCQMNSELPAEQLCPQPFISLGGRCILIHHQDYEWIAALRACSNTCTNCTFASVHSQEEINILYDMLDEQ